MEKEEVLELKQINSTLDKIYEYISKQPNRLTQLFNTALAVVGILGIIGVIDIIINWVFK